jgi:hypothetical protein
VKDVVDEINVAKELGPWKSKLLQKWLGYIVEYAKHAALDNSNMMNVNVNTIQAAYSVPIHVGDTKMSDSSHAAIDKKIVPTLYVFSGEDEDYFSFLDSTVNKLGQAGLAR